MRARALFAVASASSLAALAVACNLILDNQGAGSVTEGDAAPDDRDALAAGDGRPPDGEDAGVDGRAPDGGCLEGFATCGTACKRLADDVDNCGECGRACGGAKCAAGACVPETIVATNPGGEPHAIALQSTAYLWWTSGLATDGKLQRVAIGATPGAVETVPATFDKPWGMAIDDAQLYFASAKRLGRLLLAGGTVGPVTLTKNSNTGAGADLKYVALTAAYVYATDTGTDHLAYAAYNFSGSEIPQPLVTTTGSPWGLVNAGGGQLVVTTQGQCAGSDGHVLRVTPTGPNVVDVTANLACPTAMAVGPATPVFFGVKDGVRSVPSDAGQATTPTTIATVLGATAVAADATYVYWAVGGSPGGADGAVMRADHDGKNAVVLAEKLPHPVALAVDAAGSVYVMSSGVTVAGGPPFIGRLRRR